LKKLIIDRGRLRIYSLRDLINHFFKLYGTRNAIYLSNLRKRCDFLIIAIGDLQDAIRKEVPRELLEIALARIVSRIFCIAETFSENRFVETMSEKYPISGCSYCLQIPCVCTERRSEANLTGLIPTEQLDWSLTDWCKHLKQCYGAKNKKKGIDRMIARLFKEASELLALELGVSHRTHGPLSQEETLYEFHLEIADALAWTIAIANFLNVDLEAAVLKRFGEGCWHCHKNPCQCTNFSFEAVVWLKIESEGNRNCPFLLF
jgi:NTP pyrophosphatase (non-canonical NTP hydrolase)